MLQVFNIFNHPLSEIKQHKLLIYTLNAHCYNMTQTDELYQQALLNSDVIIPDGVGVTWAIKWLTGQKIQKIAGADLFFYEMKRLQQNGGKCFFLGSSPAILQKIEARIKCEYPNIAIMTYSPPFKEEFSTHDNLNMLHAINGFKPDVLFVGMTAPKQEKWAYTHYEQLQVGHICCIGAVFDFYAGSIHRAPQWMIQLGLEWFYRLIREPGRMWRRYLIGNPLFIWSIIKEKMKTPQSEIIK
ncbi:MAG TPA: WecB/TagA/CpsF family glycosyltransferase [Prolixibacteraceae bacterium]|nr:WecB/TagA/CpsF family glycosyltransferase [Prolixibacteraceae bacterium]